MALIDFITNLAALLLWLNWRAARMPEPSAAPGGTLASTLRRAASHRADGSSSLLAVVAILLVRGFIYWQIGPALDWAGSLDARLVVLHFRCDLPSRAMLFSVLSFGRLLLLAHVCLVLLSMLNHGQAGMAGQRFVAWQLGFIHRWPRGLKAALPFLAGTAAWALVQALLAPLHISPMPADSAFWKEAMGVGACLYLIWLPLTVLLLVLHLVESYVYLGQSAFLEFLKRSSKALLAPFVRLPLRAGPVDFAPVLLLAVVLAAWLLGSPLLEAWLRTAVY